MFEKVNRTDVVIAALLMLFVYFSIGLLIPETILVSCGGSSWVPENQSPPPQGPVIAGPSFYIVPAPLCLDEYKPVEPFPQYYNLRLLLMLVVGPGYYAFRNRSGIRDFAEAMVLLACLYYVFYTLSHFFSPTVLSFFHDLLGR